jgi:tetratricopeptide (TPR) repeat protein
MNKRKKQVAAIKITAVPAGNPLLDRFENQTLWHIILLVLLPFFVYVKTTGYELINFDDVTIISNNLGILTNIHNIGIAFKTDAFVHLHGDYYRPLQTITFMIDSVIGAGRPLVYHLSNLIYHLLTVVSLYFLLRSLAIKNLTALFAALLFSLHPLLASAVSWVPARGDLLVALFGVLLFTCFINYFKTGKKIYIFLHIVLFLLALLSKEVAIVFPVLLLFCYFFVLNEKFNIKKLLPFFIAWVSLFAFFYLLRSKVVIASPPPFIFGITPFLSNLAAIPIVLAKSILPLNLSPMPLFEPAFTLAGSVILLLLIILVIKYSLQKKWLVLMGFVWFIAFMVPPMFFKLYYSQFLIEYYEHRAYLPIIGLIIMLAFILNNKVFRANNKLLNWLPVIVIILFTFQASIHSDNFKDSYTFFGRAIDLNNAAAANLRGELYMASRDFTNAQSDLEKALALSDEGYPPALYNMGKIQSLVIKDHTAAEAYFTKTLNLDTTYIDAYIDRANERITNKNIAGAFNDINKAKQLDSFNAKIYSTLGSVYVNTSDFRSAVTGFSKAISLDSGYAEAYNDRAYSLYRLQQYDSALADCQRATNLFPQFMNAYYNKGMAYLALNKPQVAIKTFDTTLALTDNFYFGYFYRGMAKKQMNDMKGACSDWQQSVSLGFTMAQDTINKYCK